MQAEPTGAGGAERGKLSSAERSEGVLGVLGGGLGSWGGVGSVLGSG